MCQRDDDGPGNFDHDADNYLAARNILNDYEHVEPDLDNEHNERAQRHWHLANYILRHFG